jgi:hypothetical protein
MVEYDVMSELTPEIVAWLKREAVMRGLAGPARLKWAEARPLTADETQLLTPLARPAHCGPPASFEEMSYRQEADEQWWRAEKVRLEAANALGVQRRSQFHADKQAARQPGRLWAVRVQAKGKGPESGLPPLVVRAPSDLAARDIYSTLCGITGGWQEGVDARAHEWIVTPFDEPSPAAAVGLPGSV